MAGVFHRGDCADGPRPVGIVALAGEGSIAVADLSEPGCTLHLPAVAYLFLLAARKRISQKGFLLLQFLATR